MRRRNASEHLNLEQERARLARAQAERYEIRNAKERRELIHISEHEAALRRVISIIQDRLAILQSLATKCSDQFAARNVLTDFAADTMEMILKMAGDIENEKT